MISKCKTAKERTDNLENMVRLLDRNVTRAIYLSEYFDRGAYSGEDVRRHFDKSIAGGGYNLLLDAVYFELVLTMARLYDNPHRNDKAEKTASIPVVISMLSEAEIQKELESRLLIRHDPSKTKGIDTEILAELKKRSAESISSRIQDISVIITEFKDLEESHLIRRIRKVRNEFMAHTATNPTKNDRIAYGNAEDLLEKTIPFVARLQYLVKSYVGSKERYAILQEEASKAANEFWEEIIHSND